MIPIKKKGVNRYYEHQHHTKSQEPWAEAGDVYLKIRDIRPLYPSTNWKAEPIMIAPCSSLIICLKFYNIINQYLMPTNILFTQKERVFVLLLTLFPFKPWNSGELMMAKAGARKTKEGPWIKGSLDPNEVCNNVVIPQTKSTVETTFAISSYKSKKIEKFKCKSTTDSKRKGD